MLHLCRSRGDQNSLQFWTLVANVLDEIGTDGMSEEEDGEAEHIMNGRTNVTNIKNVLYLPWRNPQITAIFKEIDKMPGIEKELFSRQGTTKKQRVRVSRATMRRPPENLNRSCFDAGYLSKLTPHEVDALKFKAGDMVVPAFTVTSFTS